jgi:outer membrane protein assembly factor BamD
MARLAIVVVTLLVLSSWTADKAAAEMTVENADRHIQVARYHVVRRDYSGAINRFKIVLTKFQSSEYVEEALAGLTEAYLVLGIASEASAAAATLECKFPNGDWTAKAKALLKSAGLEPAENPASWISRLCR